MPRVEVAARLVREGPGRLGDFAGLPGSDAARADPRPQLGQPVAEVEGVADDQPSSHRTQALQDAELRGAVLGHLRRAVTAELAGPLDQRLIVRAGRVDVVNVSPGAGQLQHHRFALEKLDVIDRDPRGQLRRGEQIQLTTRGAGFGIDHAFDSRPTH